MADGHFIWKQCPGCLGTGVNPRFISAGESGGAVEEDSCLTCGGDKYIFWGWMSKDDMELPDFLPTVE